MTPNPYRSGLAILAGVCLGLAGFIALVASTTIEFGYDRGSVAFGWAGVLAFFGVASFIGWLTAAAVTYVAPAEKTKAERSYLDADGL